MKKQNQHIIMSCPYCKNLLEYKNGIISIPNQSAGRASTRGVEQMQETRIDY